MSTEDDAALLSTVRMREEALRRKEKEVAKKEMQLKEQLEQMKSMRTVMDSALQELEARELVMTDAEAKHGSLLQREEAITRRERDVDSKEETLKERLVEASKREQEAADHFKQRQREYEEKLFPLAAREQELIRREMEAQAMDHDLEIKYKQLNKHIAAEEEKEKVRDKTFRDREQVLRDQIALTDRRQMELDQLNTHLTEKQRLLKAEQVENDGRDREIKWREEQLRLAQTEVSDLKAKLVKWDAKLVVDDEALRLEVARVGLTKAEVELREAELVEKTSKLLAMDEAIQQRDEETRLLKADADVLRQKLTVEKSEVAEIRDSVVRDRQLLSEQMERMKLKESQLDEMDARLKAQAKVLIEREKSVKCWIMELQYRESQQATASQHGTNPLTSFDANEIASSTLESIQDKYLAVVAHPSAKKGSAALPPRSSSSSRGLLQPLGAALVAPAVAEASLAEAVDSVALDVKRSQLEARLDDYMSLLYALSQAERKRLFSSAEEEQLSLCEVRHQELVNELQLLWLVLVGKQLHHVHGGATAGKLAKELATFGQHFTAADWSSYYQAVRSAALRRRHEVTSLSIARLTEMISLLSEKLGDDAVAELQSSREDLKKLAGVPRIHHQQLARALPMGRSHPSVVASAVPPGKALANELPAPSAEADAVSTAGKTQRPTTKGSAKLADAKAKVVATLPEYLRHHYEE